MLWKYLKYKKVFSKQKGQTFKFSRKIYKICYKNHAKFCMWKTAMLGTNMSWKRSGWRAALQRGIWRCWSTAGSVWMKSVSLAAERANQSWDAPNNFTRLLQDMIFLLYSVLMKLHLESCVTFWTPQFKQGVKAIPCIQSRARKLEKGLERMCYEKWLRTLPSLEKRRLRGDLIALCSFLRRGMGERATEHFSLHPVIRHMGMV